MRIVSLFLLFASLAAGQSAFTGLATKANGSKLWFSSRLRLQGSDSFIHAKIFTWDAALAASADPTSGFRLLEQREAKLSFPPGSVTSFTFHELIRTSVSRDGSVVAITATADCIKLYVLRPFEHSPPRHDPSAQLRRANRA